jgi:hypothetical protein
MSWIAEYDGIFGANLHDSQADPFQVTSSSAYQPQPPPTWRLRHPRGIMTSDLPPLPDTPPPAEPPLEPSVDPASAKRRLGPLATGSLGTSS